MGRIKDITGQRFGRLTAIRYIGNGDGFWECRCDCGVVFQTRGCDLRLGRTTSCGCRRAEVAAAQGRRFDGNEHGAVPIRVVSTKGGRTGSMCFRSATLAGKWLNCCPGTVMKYLRSGQSFKDYIITKF